MFLLSVNRGLVGWRPLSSPTPHALRNPVDVLESAYLTVIYMIHSSTHTHTHKKDLFSPVSPV